MVGLCSSLQGACLEGAAPAGPPPLTIPDNCVYWYEADKGVTNSEFGVSALADQSSAGNDLVQATTTNRPSIAASSFGSLQGLLFDDVDDYMTLTTTANFPPGFSLWFAVIVGSGDYIMGDWTTDLIQADGFQRLLHRAGSTTNQLLTEPVVLTYGEADLWEIHATDAGVYSVFRVENDGGTASLVDVTAATPSTDTDDFIMSTFNSFAFFGPKSGMTFGASALFSAELSASDKSTVRDQLLRWGRTV